MSRHLNGVSPSIHKIQSEPNALEKEAGQLLSNLEKLRHVEADSRSRYVGSYAVLVTDVAKQLFVRYENSTVEGSITQAIAFAEALRLAVHDYSLKVLENVPIDPELDRQIKQIEDRLGEIQQLLQPAPKATQEETSLEFVGDEEIESLMNEEKERVVNTPKPIDNI